MSDSISHNIQSLLFKENGVPVTKFKTLLACKGLKLKNNLCYSRFLPQEIVSNEAPMHVHLHDPTLYSHSVTQSC